MTMAFLFMVSTQAIAGPAFRVEDANDSGLGPRISEARTLGASVSGFACRLQVGVCGLLFAGPHPHLGSSVGARTRQ
jgi:hypothetical protein